MIVEERCACGAQVKIAPDSCITRIERDREREEMLAQLDLWRRRHEGCAPARRALRALADETWTVAMPPYSVREFARRALAVQPTESVGKLREEREPSEPS